VVATASAELTHGETATSREDQKIRRVLCTSFGYSHVAALPVKQVQLRVNSNLEAEIKTPTTYNFVKIFVTAEDVPG
jgi:hypothetical protein